MRHDISLVEESASVLRPQLPGGRLTSSVPVRRTTEKDDNMDTTIRKAVIPAAGMGSRLLPLTKAIPKEMLPVGDRPVIEHTVRELVSSGITDITIVVSGGKWLIQDHFRPTPALVERLRAEGKTAFADAVEEIGELSHHGHITYLDQYGPYGNGTPVLNAARSFGDEPFLVLWPDDVFVAEKSLVCPLRSTRYRGCS
jgi:UTP--glucose-1-phosphate uridylyltransferase